jgi:NarL family two-component system response regulator YdfI
VTRVLVAASAARGGAGLAARLGAQKSLRVVQGAPGLSLREQVEEERPDVVLLDLDRERAAAWLRSPDAVLPTGIIVLSDDVRGPAVTEWLRVGGRALLPRHATVEEILAAIEAVGAGLVVLHPDVMAGGKPAERHARPAASQPLTPREVEVLGMMAEGLGNKIIAARLGITLYTVKFHIASIFAKLNAGSRTEAVTIGVRQGLIMI